MEEKSFDYMNVIPLVDVMMVLLTIVLMTSTFVASGLIPVDVPKATGEQRQLLKTRTITIDKDGTVYFESVKTTIIGLKERLGLLGRDTPVLVRVDRHLAIQACVDVLDAITGCGFRKIALQTECRPG